MVWFEIIVLIFLVPVAIGAWSMAPWVPAWRKDLSRIMALAQLKPGEIFYDLGCGNGKVVLYAAEHFAVNAVGVEIAWPLWLVCKIRAIQSRQKSGQVKFILGNLFKQDLRQADVVYVFGMPKKLQDKLRTKFERELKPGARVISYAFHVEGWTPAKTDKPTPQDMSIFLYQR